MKGIDVSDNNGYVDWQMVKDAGIEFAMVACSYGKTGRHDRFKENVDGAHAVGLQVGAYHYSYSLTPADALVESQNCKDAIEESGVFLELPVFFDMEDADHWKENHNFDFSKDNITGICRNFIKTIGLDCGIYASLSWLESYIDWESIGCAVWNAQWGNSDDITGYMWQYTDGLIIGDRKFDGNIKY